MALVPFQATFARLTISCSRWSWQFGSAGDVTDSILAGEGHPGDLGQRYSLGGEQDHLRSRQVTTEPLLRRMIRSNRLPS